MDKKPGTRPVSPKITRTRPPKLPAIDEISQKVVAKDVPAFLENTNMSLIEEDNRARKQAVREQTFAKYQAVPVFKFHECSKGYKSIEETRRDIEEERIQETNFSASFYKPVPNFQSNPAKIRLNVSSILREESLLRKQQAKDVSLLKNYEMELRDPTEFYIWQKDMQDHDASVKLEQVSYPGSTSTPELS